MKVKLIVLAVIGFLLLAVGLFLYIKYQQDLRNTEDAQQSIQAIQEHESQSPDWARTYVGLNTYNTQTAEGAMISQAFADQVWVYGTITNIDVNTSTGSGTITLTLNNREQTYILTSETKYHVSKSKERLIEEIRPTEIRENESIMLTITEPTVGSNQHKVLIITRNE